MKLKYINEIADTCCEFMEQVINTKDELSYDTLMKRARDVVNYIDWTDKGDLIIFDYKRMSFYVRKNNETDKWCLDKEATFNVCVMSQPIELEL